LHICVDSSWSIRCSVVVIFSPPNKTCSASTQSG
jgi:hypothetical protein